MTFLPSLLRSASECVIWGKFLKSWECAGSAWFLQLSLRSALGVRDFRKMLEVLGVCWKCVAHFCYGGGSALGVRKSALECVTNDRSAWKVRTPTHFCSARVGGIAPLPLTFCTHDQIRWISDVRPFPVDTNCSYYGQSYWPIPAQTNFHCATTMGCHYIHYSALEPCSCPGCWLYTLIWLQTPLPFCRTPLILNPDSCGLW